MNSKLYQLLLLRTQSSKTFISELVKEYRNLTIYSYAYYLLIMSNLFHYHILVITKQHYRLLIEVIRKQIQGFPILI